mmetsp:Transcript_20985/g.69991  ORF Transcript_20985/g.69991 Transcript_20985/m.69991 type:complete len:215 (-) Transcript_20985:309-953(-)
MQVDAKTEEDTPRARTPSLTKKAMELWALDRKQCKLAAAMGQLKDGKIPSHADVLLEALVKHESEMNMQEERAVERERRKRELDLRRQKTLEERRAAVANKQEVILEKKVARANERVETLEMRRRLKENDEQHLLELKATQQQYRRERERFELVEREWIKQDARNKSMQEREAIRRVRSSCLVSNELILLAGSCPPPTDGRLPAGGGDPKCPKG